MKDYDFPNDIAFIRMMLDYSQEEFAKMIGTTQISVAQWETGVAKPREATLDTIYSLALKNDVDINLLKTRFLEDDKCDNLLLYHGSKNDINGKIDLSFSNSKSDFGKGFYCGEKLEQASTWICDNKNGSVYCFFADLSSLKIERFDVNLDWIMAICIYRGYLGDKLDKPYIKRIIQRIEEADVIYAPIADNIMYLTIQEFAEGFITDVQCEHSLSANHLGMQYVFKTDEAIKRLRSVGRLYLCEDEKERYREIKQKEEKNGQDKSKASRINYRGMGKYINEII